MNYTDRIDGFQIRDVTYFGIPPAGTPPTFDIVKWSQYDPPIENVTVFRDGQVLTGQTVTEGCYSVGFLEWNRHEDEFVFRSVGVRWLEEHPSNAVVQMILDFAEKKRKELAESEEMR